MYVSCMFHVDLEVEGEKNFRERIFRNKNIIGRVTGNKQFFQA